MRNIFIIIGLLLCLLVKAQIPQVPINLQSPNIATLGMFGDVPVSLFTGIPEISVPLFKAPDNYNLNISLSYYAGGVRSDQHPGWVGTNWTLLAGGSISRIVKDQVDELNNGYYSNGTNGGFYFNYSVLNTPNWNNGSYAYSLVSQNYLKDTEPDEFSFNFCGYSGKFYLNQLGNWVVQCAQPIKVVFDGKFTDIPPSLQENDKYYTQREIKTFNKFTLITEDGTQYIFGNDTTAIEYSMEFFNQLNNQWVANSWYLTMINYPNGKSVTFQYVRGEFVSQMYISKDATLTGSIAQINKSDGTVVPISCSIVTSNPVMVSQCYGGQLIAPVYLKKIVSPNFSINFKTGWTYELRYPDAAYQYNINNLQNQYYPQGSAITDKGFLPYLGDVRQDSYSFMLLTHTGLTWRYLASISIYNNQNVRIDSINFVYNNGAGATGDPRYTSKERLFLLSLHKMNGESYYFDYDSIAKLPPYLANMTDHWGFFNNKFASLAYDSINNYYACREPDSVAVKYGSLTRITYPTGGCTEFVYEANQYSKQLALHRWDSVLSLPNNQIAGGLRIKETINRFNNNTPPVTKEYFYVNNYSPTHTSGTSSGVLGGQSMYYFNDYKTLTNLVNCLCGPPLDPIVNGTLQTDYHRFTTQSILPACENSQGNFIGYSEVVERLTDGSYTRFKFSNFDNGHLDEQPDYSSQATLTPYQPYNSKDQERGNLLTKQIYDASGNLKYTEENKYVKTQNGYVEYLNVSAIPVCPELALWYGQATAYKKYIYSMLLQSKKQTSYIGNDSIVKLSTFNYDPTYNLITRQTQNDSKNDSLIITTQYPFNCNGYAPYNVMQGKNMLNYPVETTQILNSSVTGSKLTTYEQVVNSNDTLFLPAITFLLKNTIPLTSFTPYNGLSINSQYGLPNMQYVNYDLHGNILEIKNQEGISTTYLWGYNYQYPVAKIEGLSYAQVSNLLSPSFITNLSQATSPSSAQMNTIRTTLTGQLALVTTYTYAPLIGMTSSTNPQGVTSYYQYDAFGRLSNSKNDDSNLDASYSYNYYSQSAPREYYNSSISQVFTKNNCPVGNTASQVTYTVPSGKYTTTISQAVADSMAQADINTNGQNYANENGTCTPNMYNIYLTNNSGYIGYTFPMYIDGTLHNFPANGVSNLLVATIPAGTHTFMFPCGPTSSFVMTTNTPIPANCGTQFSLSVTSDITFSFYIAQQMSANLTTASTPPANFCIHGCSYTKTVYLANVTYYYDIGKTLPVKETLIFPYNNNPNNLVYGLNGNGVPTGATFSCP